MWIDDGDDLSAVVAEAKRRKYIINPATLLAVDGRDESSTQNRCSVADECAERRSWLRERVQRIIGIDRAGTRRSV